MGGRSGIGLAEASAPNLGQTGYANGKLASSRGAWERTVLSICCGCTSFGNSFNGLLNPGFQYLFKYDKGWTVYQLSKV